MVLLGLEDEIYRAKDEALKQQILELENRLSIHRQGDDKVNDTIVKLFQFVSGAADNFMLIAGNYAKFMNNPDKTSDPGPVNSGMTTNSTPQSSELSIVAENLDTLDIRDQIPIIRNMLKNIFRTLELQGRALRFSLCFPFDEFMKNAGVKEWCGRGESNPHP